jgi:nitrous oxide reductase accessory protein NosL
MKKILFIFGLLIALSACNNEVSFEPKAINFDRDDCHICLMGLTDQRYNAQAINEFGEVRFYDDIGCLAEDLRAKEQWEKWKGSKVVFWIGDAGKENEPSNWIDAKKAFYDYGKDTPMGYGYSAYAVKPNAKEVFTFDEVLERIDAGKTMREAFIKKKKMMGKGKCGKGKCGEGKCGK